MPGPLQGIRVFDLSRILAGPTCTQLLGDLGADVIKIERPGAGDDTRKWGPPYVKGKDGKDTKESAYYLSSNRNKRSLAIDISQKAGQALARRLIAQCDIMLENFKVGDMAKYGLAYADLAKDNPRLIYCSITGFGQTGPYAPRAGYDMLAQGLGGIMSVTGDTNTPPYKVGVGIADIMCGMYATSAILAALHHREKTGQGQYIDLSLLDTQVAWLANIGLNYLTSGKVPTRVGDQRAARPQSPRSLRSPRGCHAPQVPKRVGRGAGEARRSLQSGEFCRPGLCRSAGPFTRHANRRSPFTRGEGRCRSDR